MEWHDNDVEGSYVHVGAKLLAERVVTIVLAARAAASNGKKVKTQSRIVPDQVPDLQLSQRHIVIPEEDSEILVLEEQVTNIIPEEEPKALDSDILVLEEQVAEIPVEEEAKTPDPGILVSEEQVATTQEGGKRAPLEKLTPTVLL